MDAKVADGGVPRIAALLYPNVALHARRGRYREAEAWAAQIPGGEIDADLLCLRGRIQAQQGRFDEAEALLRAALAADSGHVGAAAALVCVARLRARAAAPVAPAWKLAAVLLAVSLAVALFAPSESSRDADDGSASAARAPDPVPQPASEPKLLEDFAAVVAAVRALPQAHDLELGAISDEGRVAVRVNGSVPTHHVAQLVRASAAGSVVVDTGALRVDGRYRVRPGDTLTGIGLALYGDAGAWRGIWEANRAALGSPDRLRAGMVLAMP